MPGLSAPTCITGFPQQPGKTDDDTGLQKILLSGLGVNPAVPLGKCFFFRIFSEKSSVGARFNDATASSLWEHAMGIFSESSEADVEGEQTDDTSDLQEKASIFRIFFFFFSCGE